MLLASRTFGSDDQLRFATMSGDFNPMHMDPLAARRTQAGAVVVHGVHSLLWLLDSIAEAHPELAPVASLKARFTSMVYCGDRAEAVLTQITDTALRAEVTVNGAQVLALTGAFGPPQAIPAPAVEDDAAPALKPDQPVDLLLEEMEGKSGHLAFATSSGDAAAMFPHAARWLCARRIAALGCSTYLVGMLVPGLHSIYGSLDVTMCEDVDPADRVAFKVASIDPRFRMVREQVHGGGVSAQISCFARQPPVGQASLETIGSQVASDEFAGATALVVGGSRGLGELTAKIVAAGGGKVVITYAVGKSDAEALAAEIKSWGGDCTAIPYDARLDPEEQLAPLPDKPTHIYYFATPRIARRKSGLFDQGRFDEFNAFYVAGFEQLVRAGLRGRPEGIRAFYPSSVFVDERPAGMGEYAMAKAAGEVLCGEINAYLRKASVVVARLPMLPTDQTATIQQLELPDALTVMLPFVREVQGPAA